MAGSEKWSLEFFKMSINIKDSSAPELGLGALFASDNVVKLCLLHWVYQLGVLALFAEVVMAEAE